VTSVEASVSVRGDFIVSFSVAGGGLPEGERERLQGRKEGEMGTQICD
jgi:hypothetical protein